MLLVCAAMVMAGVDSFSPPLLPCPALPLVCERLAGKASLRPGVRPPCVLLSTGTWREGRTSVGGRRVSLRMSLREEDRNKLWDEIEDLRCKMQTAVDQEHYEEAASMRDRIKALKMQDPYSQAEVKLEEAVSAEDYAEASRLRALMQEVGKPPLRLKRDDGARTLEGLLVGNDVPSGVLQGIKNYSETVTRGTRVSVVSYYMAEASCPEDGRFMFGYNVTITNINNQTCQLVSRTWLIKTQQSETESSTHVVSGTGVIGRQPVLAYNESFSYSSLCPLSLDREYLANLPDSRVLGRCVRCCVGSSYKDRESLA